MKDRDYSFLDVPAFCFGGATVLWLTETSATSGDLVRIGAACLVVNVVVRMLRGAR